MQQRKVPPTPTPTSKVLLQLAKLSIDMTDGEFDVSWMEPVLFSDAVLEDKPCAAGVTKQVYKVCCCLAAILYGLP